MTQKAETTFSNLLHSKLDPSIYKEKMSNPFRKGTPDFYYESKGLILWAEHKHILKPWTIDKEPKDICKSQSWPPQLRWLTRAHLNGQQTLVIVGIGQGKTTQGYILSFPFNFEVQYNLAFGLEHITKYIENKVTNETAICNI